MQSRSRVREERLGKSHPRPVVIASREEAELAAIALLCLVFARPADDPERPQSRLASR